MKPMKFEWAGESIEEMLLSPRWVAEQKMDGTRGLLRLTSEGLDMNGLAHSAAVQWADQIEEGLSSIELELGDEIWLDGEIMIENGEYRVFDTPFVRMGGERVIGPEDHLWIRRAALEALAGWFTGKVILVAQASKVDEKMALLMKVEEIGGEGVVFKHRDFPYEPGQRVKHQLKHQFVKRADLVVVDRTPTSAKLGVFIDGELTQVGGCSMIGKPDAQIGEVIELKYLYWTSGGSIYQPRMVRIRPDKSPRECTLDQFRAYSREAV